MKFEHALIGILAAAVIGFIAASITSGSVLGGANGNPTIIGAATTTTSITLNTANSGTRVLATTSNALGTGYSRVYASICNPNATLAYIRLDNDKMASPTAGIPIAAAAGYDACYEITDRNLYQGSVTASSSAANVLLITEYVQ